MSEDLDAIFRYILKAEGSDRRDAVGVYADALEAAGDDNRAWMFRQEDCPLGMTPEELRRVSRGRMVMQRIRGGGFFMGSPDHDAFASGEEKPRHKVTLTNNFELGVFPVTRDQYQRVIKAYQSQSRLGSAKPGLWRKWFGALKSTAEERSPTPSFYSGNPDLPVENVSWWDAVIFCNQLSLMEKKRPYYAIDNGIIQRNVFADGYRLPTEAEWEYACRAGTTTIWPWGDTEADLQDYAWYASNSGNKTHPVGELRPNGWGLYDTLGNVWEWCDDGWRRTYLSSDAKDPMFDDSYGRLARGGNLGHFPQGVRPACRNWTVAINHRSYLGFRVAGTLA